MGPGEREQCRSEAVSTFRRIAAKGNEEASGIASVLEGGQLPENISDLLFDELRYRASPAYLTEYVMHARTVSMLSREGRDDLAVRGEEKRWEMLTDANAIGNLAALGFLPSKGQRASLVSMLADMIESQESERVFRGASNSRLVCFQALSRMVHALEPKECQVVLRAATEVSQKLSLVERYLDSSPGQADMRSLMERQLSAILGDRMSSAQERMKAFGLRRKLEAAGAGAPIVQPEPEKPRRPPGRKV